jgi:hypothetical protein
MQWSDLTTALGALLVIPITSASSQTPSSNTDFNNFLPRITEAAEQRIYRELDFLNTRTEDSTATLSTTTRRCTLPTQIIVLQSASFITPAGNTPANGKRTPLLVVSKDFLDFVWPSELSSQGPPKYLAQLSDTVVMVAPTADATYKLECTGIFRPAPISASNATTYISLNYPDLFLCALMVSGCGYQRDFGAQSDDPKMAVSWEDQYQIAKTSAFEEEQRRKMQGTNWSAMSATPESSPRK